MAKTTWMVRSGDRGYMAPAFVERGIVAIGWSEVGDVRQYQSKLDIVSAVEKAYPLESSGNHLSSAGQLLRFLKELKIGDGVITINSDTRIYHLGEITSDYSFNNQTFIDYPNQRGVKWIKEISRDSLSVETKNSLGSTLTLFKLPETASLELWSSSVDLPIKIESNELANSEPEKLVIQQAFSDLHEKSLSLIEDGITALAWDEVQELVAGLLRALGYKTTVSPKGKDRGKDIFASPDGLGLQDPRIFVEVKHRSGAMGAPEVRTFLGGRRSGDRCLYVSTGGFTQEARYEAERHPIPVTLLNIRELAIFIVDNYENLDFPSKELLPLRRLYWPLV
jgi:restriction system protein